MLKVANSVIDASRITGVLPVVNGGTGVTTSTGTGNTVLSAAPTLSGDVNLSTGNLVIGTSGKGIDFSVTSSGSGTMTSELLADYEEGTFTPTVVGTSTAGTATYATQDGYYTKVGRLVYFSLVVSWSAGTGTGDLRVAGLPFTMNANPVAYPVCQAFPGSGLAVTALNIVVPDIPINGTQVRLLTVPVGGGSANLVAYDAEAAITVSGWYFV